MAKYARTLVELRKKAVLYWPPELLEREAKLSVLPLLAETQDEFLSVLNGSNSTPDSWKKLIDAPGKLNGSLFLKHLMVLCDLGGETLNKHPPLSRYFPNGRMSYVWRGKTYEYSFKIINDRVPLTNAALHVDGKHLIKLYPLDDTKEDVIMLLLHGATAINDTLPPDVKDKCVGGRLMGDTHELDSFLRQNYIRVSRQIGGAAANALGQIAQDFVIDILKKLLPKWRIVKNSTLPNVSHTGGKTGTRFDVVARSPNNRYFGIQVTFQVTANSPIQLMAVQAEARAKMVHDAGHSLCYVIDGAGNINIRRRAVEIICSNSDCTVALSTDEIAILAEFMSDAAGV